MEFLFGFVIGALNLLQPLLDFIASLFGGGTA